MNLSEHFTLEEFVKSSMATKLGISNHPDDIQLLRIKTLCESILEPVRNKFGYPVIITSGFRTKVLNKAVKGAESSQHLKGEAADIVSGNNLKLWKIINDMIRRGEIEVGQLINEKNLSWIHISLPDKTHRNQILTL